MAKTNTFDTGAEGATVNATTTANDGAACITPVVNGTGAGVYRAASAVRGARGIRASGVAGDSYQIGWSETAAASISYMVAFWVDGSNLPTSASVTVIRTRSSGGNTSKILYSTSGVLSVQNAAGSTLKNFNSNAKMADGKYWVCGQITTGSSTTTGSIAVQVYRDSDLTQVDSYSSTTVDAGTTNQLLVQIGKCETGGNAPALDFDEISMRNAATPVAYSPSAATPVAAATGTDAWVIDATGSQGATSYSIAQTSGPSFTPVSIGTGRWYVTRDSSGDRVYTITATGSGSSTVSHTVPHVATTTAAPVQRLRRVAGVWQ